MRPFPTTCTYEMPTSTGLPSDTLCCASAWTRSPRSGKIISALVMNDTAIRFALSDRPLTRRPPLPPSPPAEFIIPCTLVVLLVSTWSNIARFMKDGDQARIVLFVNSGSLIHTVLLLFVEVFLVGASITSHGKDVAKALRDLSLHLPSATSDHFVAVLDRLQAHAGAHPPAFRPHGFTINIGIAVAALNIIVTVGVACFVERTLEGLPM
mmetsp:Transcript_30163/g.69936  ORF Transcript_30163/g.69936 Transcript_30163/m.69936 type:complete len:210 (+) Transcript_30163:908-1537(+)